MLDGAETDHSLGLVEEHEWLRDQKRVTFARVGVIDPLSARDYEAHGGMRGLRNALAKSPEQVVEDVIASGLRGRGGAGFPAGIKWKTVLGAQADVKFVCCNADEGDSGTFADRMLMEGDPFTLIEGMTIAAYASGATEGFIYIRSEYPDAVATLRRAIEIAYAHNWLGRTSSAAAFGSTWTCGSAPARTSAAKRPRCWTVSRASAAWSARSRRFLRWRACSAARPWSTTCSRSARCR